MWLETLAMIAAGLALFLVLLLGWDALLAEIALTAAEQVKAVAN